nr:uncharacterized protein LOC108066833 [Drosophila takahashii]
MQNALFYILLMLIGKAYTYLPKTYDIRFISVKVTGPDFVDLSKVRFLGRDRKANGTVEVKEIIDNTYSVSVDSFIDSNGGGDYKQLPFSAPLQKFCNAVNSHWSYIEKTLKYGENTDFPIHTRPCPVPKGIYYFKEVLANTDGWPTMMPRGYLKGVVKLFKNGKYVGGAEAVSLITDIAQ